jgi:hypothetical protein
MALTAPSLSPAIIVREFDLTPVVPNVDTSLSGYVGQFKWGPVDVPTIVQTEEQLAQLFGVPDEERAVDYFSAAQFLRYSGNLIVNRTIPTGDVALGDSALNATSGGGGLLVRNEEHFESQTVLDMFVAKYPGLLGSSIKVAVFAIESGESASTANSITAWENWEYADKFDAIPGTSEWAKNQPGTVVNDETHIAIIDENGLISGTKNSVLETFAYVSVAKGAKTVDGGENFMPNVLNGFSKLVWMGKFDSAGGNDTFANGVHWGTAPSISGTTDYAQNVSWSSDSAAVTLGGGVDHTALDVGDYMLGWDNFEDAETLDVSMLIAPGFDDAESQITIVNDLTAIAALTRKDCIAVASPNRAAVVGSISPVTDTLATTNRYSASSYLVVDNNYLRVYDKYNDNYIYIPAASTTAGIMAATDYNYGPWYSPAGERRGEYFGATNLAYNARKADRDELYKKGVNPIIQYAGRGMLLWGDKTKLARPSAFDRVNVRRLFLALEKSISVAARNFLFEFNDEFTRAEFVGIVEPLLREIQGRRGIQDFFVQCDEQNNTPEVIDRNEMVATIFVKPARSINFITLNFVATRTGADFEEIVQRVNF